MSGQHTLKVNDKTYTQLKAISDKRNITVSALISLLSSHIVDITPEWLDEPTPTKEKLPCGIRGC